MNTENFSVVVTLPVQEWVDNHRGFVGQHHLPREGALMTAELFLVVVIFSRGMMTTEFFSLAVAPFPELRSRLIATAPAHQERSLVPTHPRRAQHKLRNSLQARRSVDRFRSFIWSPERGWI